jgi:hypothetical protein
MPPIEQIRQSNNPPYTFRIRPNSECRVILPHAMAYVFNKLPYFLQAQMIGIRNTLANKIIECCGRQLPDNIKSYNYNQGHGMVSKAASVPLADLVNLLRENPSLSNEERVRLDTLSKTRIIIISDTLSLNITSARSVKRCNNPVSDNPFMLLVNAAVERAAKRPKTEQENTALAGTGGAEAESHAEASTAGATLPALR